MAVDLENMTLEELEELKKKWYEEAKTNGSIGRCLAVCRQLGSRLAAQYGPKYRYILGDLELYVDDYGHYATASYQGKRVMSTHPCDCLFIPGIWMERVEREYPRALKAEKKEEQDEIENKRRELISKLTL